MKDLVTYCVSRINLRTTSALHGTACPRFCLFTGVKPNFRKELSLAFGDYVELYTGTDNMSRERSTPCIALYPVGNGTGAWQFWNLRSGKYMRHSTWVRMNTNELIIDTVNAEADRTADSTEQVGAEISTNPSMASDIEAVTIDNNIEVEEGIDRNAEPDLGAAPELLEAGGAAGTDSGTDIEVVGEVESRAEAGLVDEWDTESGGQTVEPRHSARIATGTKPPVRYVHATFVGKDRWEEPAAKAAINSEITQLFKELHALKPVHHQTIATGACILTCHLFLVEKFLADGKFERNRNGGSGSSRKSNSSS